MAEDLSDPKHWNDIYLAGDAGWDKGRPSPPLVRLSGEGLVPAGAKLVVLGAGRGHDALALAKKGFRVTAVDFAEEAAKAMRAGAKKAKADIEVLQEDIFALPKTRTGAFDAAVEHTCFCAIDPKRRAEYVDVAHAILVPGGTLLGLFYAHGREGGPPYTTDEAEVRRLFGKRFTLERLVRAPDSFQERAGAEIEFVFRAKG